jgi:WD40 repeat protein/DNA-binding SARP family transcriptional activator
LVVETGSGRLSPRDRVVLAVLVVHHEEVVSVGRLADALWGDSPPASASKVVQGCVARLRKALGPESIETQGAGYCLVLDGDDVDVWRFERLLARAREQLALRTPERALRTAEDALALWRGRPFDELERWEAGRLEANRLEELKCEADEVRLDAALRAGRHQEVLATARGLVDALPTRERRWELLALAQYRAGSQADALRTLHEARRRLADELGLEPGAGIVGLEQAILHHDEELEAPEAPAEIGEACPWPGLLSYTAEDGEAFAGREREVEAGLIRLAAEGVLVIVGPSGSGKSSLVRAGIAGRLRGQGRRVIVVTPGSRPLDALERHVPRDGCVLVIDQLEELVTTCDSPAQRDAFLDGVVAHAQRDLVVLALRADRLGDLSERPGLVPLVERGLFLLGPMDESALRAAIERPARAAGLLLEPGLVDLIVRDVLGEPGALPLMSHALQQTWRRREGRTLTVAGYTDTGGIRQAVALSAEALYACIAPEDQSKLRDLLVRLVTPVEDGAPARARLPRRAIADDPGYQRLVDQLVDARLLTTDGEVVELAHEALARAWPRFRDWLDEDAEGVRILRHLNSTAAGWDTLGCPDTELYRGERLAGVVDWRSRSAPELTAIEEAFVKASVDKQREELRAAEVQVERERGTVRRLRRLVTGAALLAAMAVVATVLAVHQREKADDQARVAEARRLSAEALETRPYDRALLLALEAVRRSDDQEAQGALLTTIGRSPRIAGVLRSGGPRFVDLDLPSAADWVAVSDEFGGVSLYDLATREVADTIATRGRVNRTPEFSPDGRSLAVTSLADQCFVAGCGPQDYSVDVYDVTDLSKPPARYRGMDGPPVEIAWSPDGEHLAAAAPILLHGPQDSITVWRVGDFDDPIKRLTPEHEGIDLRPTTDPFTPAWLAFSPDGSTLYASGAGPVSALDLATGEIAATYDGLGGVALSSDGRTLAMLATPQAVRLVDTETGRVHIELDGHDDTVTAVAFSEDGSRVATGGNDETVIVWDATTGTRLMVLEGHVGSIADIAFDIDGAKLYTAAADRSILMCDVDGAAGLVQEIAPPFIDAPGESTVLVNPTGDVFAVMAESVQLVSARERRAVALHETQDFEVAWGSFSPDGQTFATVDFVTGRTRLWRVADGRLLASRVGRGEDNLGAIAFTADGRSILVADADGTVVELDRRTLEPTGRSIDLHVDDPPTGIRTGPGGRFAVSSSEADTSRGTSIVFGDLDEHDVDQRVHVSSWSLRGDFSADGLRYAWGGFDGRLGVVDLTSGDVRGPADPVHTGPVSWVSFSPDGSSLASVGFDGLLILSSGEAARPRARITPGAVNRNAALAFRPDGHTVVLVYRDGTVLSFDSRPGTWAAHACAVAGRDLTSDEWRDAFNSEDLRPTC